MRTKLIVITIFLLFLSCKQQQNTKKLILSSELQTILNASEVNGAILIFDFYENKYYSNNFKEARKSVIPASTFKIVHSIIGLETNILESEATIFKWKGEKREFPIWEKDLTLKEAFQKSCVPCYQELARKIGTKQMSQYLSKLNFGEMKVNDETIDNFWLVGQSKINSFQQIDFLKRLFNKEINISKSTNETILKILKIRENPNFLLSGKTGLGMNPNGNIGWFVGFIQKGKKVYYFATRISPNKRDMPQKKFNTVRKTVTFSALRKLKIIE